MRIEEIVVRQEVRQMLNEAGINKNTLKDMVKEVIHEEVRKAINQKMDEVLKEYDFPRKIEAIVNKKIRQNVEEAVYDRVFSVARKMEISVNISGEEDTSK